MSRNSETARGRALVTIPDSPWVVVTPTRVAAHSLCPRKYYNASVLQIAGDDVAGDAAVTGTAVHEALATAHLAGRCISDKAVLDAGAFEDGLDRSRYLKTHRHLCPSATNPDAELLGIEVPLAWWDRETMTHFRGQADAIWSVDGDLAVRDYKTGRRPGDEHSSRVDVAIYAVLVAAGFPGRRPISVEFEYLDTGTIESAHFDPPLLRTAVETARDAAARLRSDSQATPGSHCANCAYRRSCPESTAPEVPS